MTVEKQVNDLVINKMTKAQFDALENHSDTELYIVVDSMPVISYNDLTDKPSIGEGTLTIEKNGTSIGTFNANTNSNKTISFSVPTTVVELSDSSNYTLKNEIKSINGNSLLGSGNLDIDGLPNQTGNSGKFLSTNGSTASWETVDALKNTATGTNSLTILGTPTNSWEAIGIGFNSDRTPYETIGIGNNHTYTSVSNGGYTAIGDNITINVSGGGRGVIIGNNTSVSDKDSNDKGFYNTVVGYNSYAKGGYSIALGSLSHANGYGTIQIGPGLNSTNNTLSVGFILSSNDTYNYRLLDGTTGKIPDDRLNTTIARTSQIPTVDQTYDGTSSNAQSGVAIAGAKFIQNASTNPTSISIGGVSSTALSLNIGGGSHVYADYSTALGAGSAVGEQGTEGIAIGHGTLANQNYSIQLGKGTNNEANSFYVGLSGADNYKLLGSDGKIPDDRLNTTIARTSNYYTKAEVDAMIGNIEAILQRLNSGNN